MAKNLEKPTTIVKVNDDTAVRIAAIWGKSKRYVNMVIAGERYHEGIMESYLQLRELKDAAVDIVKKTALIKQVEKTVPFN